MTFAPQAKTLLRQVLASPRATEGRPLIIVGLVGAAFLLAPGPLLTKLQAAAFGVCPQRPAHSLFLGGEQLPLEARMLGIFGGYALTILYLLWVHRGRRAGFPPLPVSLLLLGFIGLLAADGVNAVAADLRLPHLYPPGNEMRLMTGLLAGMALAAFLFPAVSLVFFGKNASYPVLHGIGDLGKLGALHGSFFLIILIGAGPFLYPVAFLGILGLMAYVSVINLLILAVFSKQASGAPPKGLLNLGSWSLLLTFGELATLAGLRLLLGPTLGFALA